MRYRLLFLAVLPLISSSALGLNILLTNDDGWDSNNTAVLKSKLVAAGHDVVLAGPCLQQSGQGGSVTMVKALSVDLSRAAHKEYCIGDRDLQQSYADFAEGTPVISALYGIDILADKIWGKRPDLLIAGPNYGNNPGVMHNQSGTLSAALAALNKGVPAMAVSAHSIAAQDASHAPIVADIVVEIIGQLEKSRKASEPLLPLATGLNVNTPMKLASHRGIKFTRLGWSQRVGISMTEDLSKNDVMMTIAAVRMIRAGTAKDIYEGFDKARKEFAGALGLTFNSGSLDENDPQIEGNALADGYVTISVINGDIQASPMLTTAINGRLSGLRVPISEKSPSTAD